MARLRRCTQPQGDCPSTPVRGAPAWTPPAELAQSRQALEMVGARPYSPPPVAPWAEPAPRPRRRLRAVVGLHRAVVDERPAAADVDDEAGVAVAGAGSGGAFHARTLPLGRLAVAPALPSDMDNRGATCRAVLL